MTEINRFLQIINEEPSLIADVDWYEETDWFNENRIMLIIYGIKDDGVCQLVRDFIIESWYDACDRPYLLGGKIDSLYKLKDDSLKKRFKYVPIEDCEDDMFMDLSTIEDTIDSYMQFREVDLLHQKRKDALAERTRKIANSHTKGKKTKVGIEPFGNDDFFSNHYYNEYQELTKSNEQLKKEVEKYKNENQQLKKEVDRWKNENRQLKKRLANVDVRKLIENIISYAEKFPSNQNEKAEVIKEVLMSKLCNGIISSSTMSGDLMYRLTNLGRKEPLGTGLRIDNLNANNLYDVHNNGEVKF